MRNLHSPNKASPFGKLDRQFNICKNVKIIRETKYLINLPIVQQPSDWRSPLRFVLKIIASINFHQFITILHLKLWVLYHR